MNTEERTELWDQYQHEMANEYGFGHASEWNKGPRNFAAFLATKRVAADFDKAFSIITNKP